MAPVHAPPAEPDLRTERSYRDTIREVRKLAGEALIRTRDPYVTRLMREIRADCAVALREGER